MTDQALQTKRCKNRRCAVEKPERVRADLTRREALAWRRSVRAFGARRSGADRQIWRYRMELRTQVLPRGSAQVMHQVLPQRSTQLRRRAHAGHLRGGAARPGTP